MSRESTLIMVDRKLCSKKIFLYFLKQRKLHSKISVNSLVTPKSVRITPCTLIASIVVVNYKNNISITNFINQMRGKPCLSQVW